MNIIRNFILFFNYFCMGYTILLSCIYILQIIISFIKIREDVKIGKSSDFMEYKDSENLLPISLIIPAYNEEDNIVQNVKSLMKLNYPEFELIVVNDGSKDKTHDKMIEAFKLYPIESAHMRPLETAKVRNVYYNVEYPNLIYVDKENGGHGDAVNAGLDHAEGKYFKVVDSDDWVDEEALYKILDVLKTFENEEKQVDMLLANYVYEKEGMEHKKVIEYKNVLPQEEIFGWNDVKHFHLGQYILMHSVIYRTDFLKLCQLRLPKHTFYVDNIYVYYPLPHVRKMYYMDVDFYRYYIGREDQSVNEKVMISRVDQQIFVTKSMIDMYDMRKISYKKLRTYMTNYLAIMMTVSSILLIRSKNAENLEKKRELWQYLKKNHYGTYWKIRYGILGQTMNLPGRSGRKISSLAYIVARRIVGFN